MRRTGLTCTGLQVAFFIFVQIISAYALCPSPWESFSDSCYVYINHSVSWIDALIFCKNEGGNLLEISSEAENSFVTSLIQKDKVFSVWLGVSRLLLSTRWRRVSDGATQTFIKWAPLNPSNTDGIERCVEIDANGYWNDLHCRKHFRRIICKG